MLFFLLDFFSELFENQVIQDSSNNYKYLKNILNDKAKYKEKYINHNSNSSNNSKIENCNIELSDYKLNFDNNYRYKQIHNWIFDKYEDKFSNMSNLSKQIRESLISKYKKTYSIELIEILEEKNTETIKLKLKTFDSFIIEEVILKDYDRFTLCVSSQIGCPVGCKFCATGNCGFQRNLTFFEIIEQVLLAGNVIINKFNLNKKTKPIDNIVFMGMGEPLLNLNNVFAAIEILNSNEFFNISSRKITISTCGIENKLDELFEFHIPVRISFSLHSTIEQTRKKIIPISSNLENIIKKFEEYYNRTKNRVTIEYTLIKGINDTEEEIKNLINISKRLGNFVNLIEYNTVDGIDFKATDREKINNIREVLEKNGINVAIRFRRGREIKGACGQLLYEKENKCIK
ncbi:MAG: 23S rRNA (adenine(2503)-C(2))-methyltransferase RlmN [Spirochaetes bacterium]|nr:23S rRNA (adenine(2503)-C(2))-methyltransferase RlmN [Spirochaetota bacterium]